MSPSTGIARRSLRLALAWSLLVSNSFHFHPTETLVEPSAAREGGVLLRSAASHPSAPHHVESFHLERAPRCLECLLNQKNRALDAPVSPLSAALAPSAGSTPLGVARPLLRRARDPGQPRGPPLR